MDNDPDTQTAPAHDNDEQPPQEPRDAGSFTFDDRAMI